MSYPQQPYPQQPYGAHEPPAGPPGYYQQQQPPGYYGQRPPTHVRKKRRIFLWVFLAIQALFVLWLVVGLATTNTAAPASQVASACYHHAWYPLFSSQADCVKHFGGALTDAGDVGKAIGAGLIVLLWIAVDLLTVIPWAVYRLATRSR
jgi:hypothetical protein